MFVKTNKKDKIYSISHTDPDISFPKRRSKCAQWRQNSEPIENDMLFSHLSLDFFQATVQNDSRFSVTICLQLMCFSKVRQREKVCSEVFWSIHLRFLFWFNAMKSRIKYLLEDTQRYGMFYWLTSSIVK